MIIIVLSSLFPLKIEEHCCHVGWFHWKSMRLVAPHAFPLISMMMSLYCCAFLMGFVQNYRHPDLWRECSGGCAPRSMSRIRKIWEDLRSSPAVPNFFHFRCKNRYLRSRVIWKVKKHDVFFAIKGKKFDGNYFIAAPLKAIMATNTQNTHKLI